MNSRIWSIVTLVTILAWGLLPETSQAQFFGGRRGVSVGIGSGYGGYGYGNYGYGSGWGNPGYYNGGWGSGISVGVGNRFGSPGYYNNGYYNNGFYSNGIYNNGYSTPIMSSSQPIYSNGSFSNGTTSSYQSFYPQTVNGAVSQSNDPCCCGGPAQTQMAGSNQGSGTLVVNVPENAQLFWNGATPMVGNGSSRRFTMQATGTPQRIEARWTGPDGQTVTQTREVLGRPNDTVTVDFSNNSNNNNANTNTNNTNNNNNSNSNNNNTSDGRVNETTPNNARPN